MEIKPLNIKDSTFIYYKSTKQHTSLVDEIQDHQTRKKNIFLNTT
jgi:hypothetical protein